MWPDSGVGLWTVLGPGNTTKGIFVVAFIWEHGEILTSIPGRHFPLGNDCSLASQTRKEILNLGKETSGFG